MKSGRSSRGFTLLETLVAVVLIGIVALAAVPLLSSQNPTKLDVAAAEVGNALRFALGEVERLGGGCVWVDGSIVPGHLRVYSSATCSSSSSGWVVVTDPLTNFRSRLFRAGKHGSEVLSGRHGLCEAHD